MKANLIYVYLILVVSMVSCQNKKQAESKMEVSTIDSILQVKIADILKDKMVEINALTGQAIIMEVQTGYIKALVGLTKKDSAEYQFSENFSMQQPTGLMRPISLLMALETGKVKLSDTIDTGNGVCLVDGKTLVDHNWHRGGYGKVTVEEGLTVSSNIAIYKIIEKAFGNDNQSFFDLLTKMDYGKSDSIKGISYLEPISYITPKDKDWTKTSLPWLCIGYNQLISPIQMLTFYNAIANNGKMVQPQLYKDSAIVINQQIASKVSIDSLKHALALNIIEGMGKTAYLNKVAVAGMQGTTVVAESDDTEYAMEFCGYFPANDPKYTIIISINKKGLPASGSLMAGEVFRKIVALII